ncbi:MAG: CheR family methyltransferase [Acetobacteraceae bacterium]
MAQGGGNGGRPEYDDMPAGAIATGAVDLIAPVDAMPGQLIRLRDARLAADKPIEASPEDIEAARLAICATLRTRLGHDFSGYKDKTFLRRVQRRMQVLNIAALGDYVARLERDHDEAVLLFRDLLIRVTSFFRDSETFAALDRTVMPRLFDGKFADGAVRVWVPGCATGEEAYSLAILLREHMDARHGVPKVQVFGTDIDEAAIATARAGRYPASLLDGLSAARRARFFTRSDAGYVVAKEIRELCTFSPHSLVRDPPFSRMELISCRNLLIYLDADLQASVLPAFHYSLVPGGVLVLGASESISLHEDLFEPLDKASHIFQRRDVRSPPLRLSGWERHGQRSTARTMPRETPLNWPHESTRVEADRVRSLGRDIARETAANAHRRDHAGDRPPPRAGLLGALKRFYAGSADAEGVRDLRETRDRLRAITEDHEAALEELRAANEELHSVNEELQSANEELETSKEEIQSGNEELHTVNAQLSEKVDELARANSDLKNLFDSTDVATVFLDRHLIIRSYTPAIGGIYNLIPSDQGRPLTDIASRLNYGGLREDVEHVLDTLEPLERRVSRTNHDIHYLLRILPYRSPDSSVSGTLVTFVDVTTIVRAEQHQRLLVDELNHRVKNMLTVVVSLASQTLNRSRTLEEFSEAFMGRVHALTASYTLLSRENWQTVSLRDVVTEETRAYQSPERANIVIEGPDVSLEPQAALAMGMAIHELATNAVKYGGLSVPEGIVEVTWRLQPDSGDPDLVLDWVEKGGPPVGPPARRGFGMTLVERGFPHELAGEAKLAFEPNGLHATLRAPLRVPAPAAPR